MAADLPLPDMAAAKFTYLVVRQMGNASSVRVSDETGLDDWPIDSVDTSYSCYQAWRDAPSCYCLGLVSSLAKSLRTLFRGNCHRPSSGALAPLCRLPE